MNAKEERLHNLEIHKITRLKNEVISKNAALEAECKHLRTLNKQESEKHATNHAAMMQRMNAAIEVEREKIIALQRHFEKEQERLIDQSHKDAAAQRITQLESLGDIKRELDIKCNQKLNENKAAFDAAMRDLERERERIKRDEQTRTFQMNEQREHMNRELNETRERMKREEKEQVMQFLNKMELEREKINTLQLQLENDRAQVRKEAELQHQKIKQEEEERRINNLTHMESERKKLQNEAELHRQSIFNQVELRFNAKCKENEVAFETAMQKLNQERTQFKQHLNEERSGLILRLRQQNARDVLEREKVRIFQVTLENEREKVRILQLQVENERKQMAEKAEALFKSNKEALDLSRKELAEERERTIVSFDTAMQKLVQDREQFKKLTREQKNAKRIEERERNAKDEIMRMLQLQVENERKLLAQQAINDDEQMTPDILRLNSQLVELQKTNMVYQSKINELNEQLMHSLSELKEQFYSDVKKDLHDTVDSNFQHMRLLLGLDFKGKRVMVYSHYSEYDDVEGYNVLSLECIEHYFDYIIILTNCPNKWNIHSPNYNKYYLLNYNMKSDFRNYGVFIMQSEKVLGDASRLCFINDSFLIVDVNAYGLCMKQFFNNEMTMCDFGGLTSSYEGTFHLQSYLMCFNGPTIPHVLVYFETNGLPANHGYAISKYELGITKYLTDKMFSPYAVVSNDDMRIPLNTTCIKWEKVFEKTGIIKRQHFLKQYAYSAMTDDDIARVATNHFYNKHFIHYLNYHGINQKSV